MPAITKRKCPECRKTFTCPSVEAHKPYPFCSDRCKLVDLGAWLTEKYAIVENVNRDLEQALDEEHEIESAAPTSDDEDTDIA